MRSSVAIDRFSDICAPRLAPLQGRHGRLQSGLRASRQQCLRRWPLYTPHQVQAKSVYMCLRFLRTVVPAIAISVSCRNHEKAENPGSTPVSATKGNLNGHLAYGVRRLESKSNLPACCDADCATR